MKKLALIALLTASAFAWDIGSAAKSVGSAMGITADSLGTQLYEVVKTKAPETTEQAKSYCTQASTYKQFVGIADDGITAKAIDICAQKASANTTSDTTTSSSTTESTTSSAISAASKLLGN